MKKKINSNALSESYQNIQQLKLKQQEQEQKEELNQLILNLKLQKQKIKEQFNEVFENEKIKALQKEYKDQKYKNGLTISTNYLFQTSERDMKEDNKTQMPMELQIIKQQIQKRKQELIEKQQRLQKIQSNRLGNFHNKQKRIKRVAVSQRPVSSKIYLQKVFNQSDGILNFKYDGTLNKSLSKQNSISLLESQLNQSNKFTQRSQKRQMKGEKVFGNNQRQNLEQVYLEELKKKVLPVKSFNFKIRPKNNLIRIIDQNTIYPNVFQTNQQNSNSQNKNQISPFFKIQTNSHETFRTSSQQSPILVNQKISTKYENKRYKKVDKQKYQKELKNTENQLSTKKDKKPKDSKKISVKIKIRKDNQQECFQFFQKNRSKIKTQELLQSKENLKSLLKNHSNSDLIESNIMLS